MENYYIGTVYAVDVLKREALLDNRHNQTFVLKFKGKRTELSLIRAMQDRLIVCAVARHDLDKCEIWIETLNQLIPIPQFGELNED